MDVSKCFIWGSKIEWMHLEMSVCQSEEESLLVDGHSNYLETTISPIFSILVWYQTENILRYLKVRFFLPDFSFCNFVSHENVFLCTSAEQYIVPD